MALVIQRVHIHASVARSSTSVSRRPTVVTSAAFQAFQQQQAARPTVRSGSSASSAALTQQQFGAQQGTPTDAGLFAVVATQLRQLFEPQPVEDWEQLLPKDLHESHKSMYHSHIAEHLATR